MTGRSFSLGRRVEALEKRAAPPGNRWHRVIVESGQSADEALAVYQAEHGPIGNDNVILRQMFEPGRPIPSPIMTIRLAN